MKCKYQQNREREAKVTALSMMIDDQYKQHKRTLIKFTWLYGFNGHRGHSKKRIINPIV